MIIADVHLRTLRLGTGAEARPLTHGPSFSSWPPSGLLVGLLRSFSIGLRRCTGVSVMTFRAGQMVALSESGRRGSRMIQPSAFPDITTGIVKALNHERQ